MANTAKKTVENEATLTLVEKSFQEKLADKIAEAQERAKDTQNEAMEKLLDNEKFIEAQRIIGAKEAELSHLNLIINQLNNITPFKANDGRKFSVNVYPINQFGIGLGQVMGIIAGSRSAFVDETRLQYCAITGLTSIELYEAVEALGSPAYFKDGTVHDAIPGNFSKLENLLPGIFIRLGLVEYKAEQITESAYDLYFATAEAKALRQLKEHDELQKLDKESSDFVLSE